MLHTPKSKTTKFRWCRYIWFAVCNAIFAYKSKSRFYPKSAGFKVQNRGLMCATLALARIWCISVRLVPAHDAKCDHREIVPYTYRYAKRRYNLNFNMYMFVLGTVINQIFVHKSDQHVGIMLNFGEIALNNLNYIMHNAISPVITGEILVCCVFMRFLTTWNRESLSRVWSISIVFFFIIFLPK